jgi:signal transduction histidine kinase
MAFVQRRFTLFCFGQNDGLKEGDKGFVKIARDQTKRLEVEKAHRDKEILQKIVHGQETERKRIARDLHDELGQQLTALRLKLERIRSLCDGDMEMRAQIDETQVIARSIDDGVDFLAWELRPSVLDALGLFAALENMSKNGPGIQAFRQNSLLPRKTGFGWRLKWKPIFTALHRKLSTIFTNTRKLKKQA